MKFGLTGMLIDVLKLNINSKGTYEIKWDAWKYASGVFYSVDFGDEILFSKLVLLE